MSWVDTLLGSVGIQRISKVQEKTEDLRADIGEPENRTPDRIIKVKRRPRSSVLSYEVGSSNIGRNSNNFRPPMHDLLEVARAIDTEAYLARSIQKHREFILKEGYTFHGKDPETVEYIRNRMREFELISGITTEEWIRESVTNLVSYHNLFLVLKREIDKSTGRPIRLHGRRLDPIAGIFPMDPTSVYVEQNKSGRPVRWKQSIDNGGRTKVHNAVDICHAAIDKKTGFVFGTPYCIPVLDDIRSLRRLEELAELVTHKHLFPLFHYKVGNEKRPADMVELPDGTLIDEVDIVKSQVEEMPTEGGIVTSERHEIKLIGSEGLVLNIDPYIKHFEARVLGGLRLSGVDLGRGDTSNRGTATTMSKNLVDAVKDYQCVLSDQITAKILDILVLEGGFDLTEETRVRLVFPSADREEMRAHETQGLLLFQGNAITLKELRNEYLQKDELSDEEVKDTSFELFTKTMGLLNSKNEDDQATESTVTNKSQPENQQGVMQTKPKISKNDTYIAGIAGIWRECRQHIVRGKGFDNFSASLNSFIDEAMDYAKPHVHLEIDKGVSKAKTDCKSSDSFLPSKSYDIFLIKTLKNDFTKINRKATILLNELTYDSASITGLFDSLETEIKFMCDRHLKVAFRFGYAQSALKAGYNVLRISSNADDTTVKVDLREASFKDLYLNLVEDSEIKCTKEVEHE